LDSLEFIDGRSCVHQTPVHGGLENVWARVYELNDHDQTATRAILISPPPPEVCSLSQRHTMTWRARPTSPTPQRPPPWRRTPWRTSSPATVRHTKRRQRVTRMSDVCGVQPNDRADVGRPDLFSGAMTESSGVILGRWTVLTLEDTGPCIR